MTSFIIKLIVCPAVVYLAGILLEQVQFTSLYQPLLIGTLVAIAGTVMEFPSLKAGTVWTSAALDFIAATFVVYLVPLFLAGATVTFTGALITGLALAITEVPQHHFLVRSRRTIKSVEQEQID